MLNCKCWKNLFKIILTKYFTGSLVGSDFDGANMEGDEDPDHVAEDISVNPLYGDMSNPDVIAMDWIQSSGDRPTSLTMKSVTNPNYESTIEVGAQRERVASNPIYQTTAEYEGENPLYETGAGVSEREISNADVNPLYEPGPVVRGGSGGMADLNPLYQSTVPITVKAMLILCMKGHQT